LTVEWVSGILLDVGELSSTCKLQPPHDCMDWKVCYIPNYILMYVEKRTNICKGNLNGQSYIVDLVLKYQPGNWMEISKWLTWYIPRTLQC
jgi:hypothetical protein